MKETDPERQTQAEPVTPIANGEQFAPGAELPGHVILSVLGSGNMGVVYCAKQTALDRVVALKTVQLGRQNAEKAAERFAREAKSVARLRHPNIVTAYDSGRAGDVVYYTMELLEGGTLEDRLRKGGVCDEAFTWQVIRQAAAGLSQAAAEGVVHRDVKPGNLFLTPPPSGFPLPPGVPLVKVTDFGLAIVKQSVAEDVRLTASGLAVGTPMYMAPEQFQGLLVDHRADIYALGITAYEMLTGKAPFDGGTVWDLMRAKMTGTVMEVGGVSPRSLGLIRAMTVQKAEERLQTYAELLDRIDDLLAGRAVTAPVPSGKKTRPVAVAAKMPWLKIVAAGVVLGALVAGGVVALQSRGGPEPPPGWRAGDPTPLFRGGSLLGWEPLNGSWGTGMDKEHASTLAGRGLIRRPLSPMADYRVTVQVDLCKASAVELQFAIRPPQVPGGARLALRASKDEGVAVVKRAGNDTPSVAVTAWQPWPAAREGDGPQYRELRVERVAGRWYAAFDDRYLGGFADDGPSKLPEFRLFAEGGEAHFEGIEVAPMKPE